MSVYWWRDAVIAKWPRWNGAVERARLAGSRHFGMGRKKSRENKKKRNRTESTSDGTKEPLWRRGDVYKMYNVIRTVTQKFGSQRRREGRACGAAGQGRKAATAVSRKPLRTSICGEQSSAQCRPTEGNLPHICIKERS